jgi:hypothetical protein
LRVAHFNGVVWEDKGNTQFSSTGSEGWIISDTVSQFSPFRLGSIGGNSLPVKLIQFSAKESGETHFLSWESADETNFHRYEVEQSANGVDFHVAEIVAGKGKASNYSITVPSTHWETTFYRLKMVDFDGTFYFSPIQRIVSNDLGISMIWNTSNGSGSVQLNATQPSTLKVSILGMSGQMIHQEMLFLKGNHTSEWVILSVIPNGIFLITLETDGKKWVKKVAIQR